MKHKILSGYLDAWAAIMSRHAANIHSSRPIRFIDAFAGPGVFLMDGAEHPGSPILSLRSIANHATLPMPINAHFIEAREDRCARLKLEIEKEEPIGGWPSHLVVHQPEHGCCNVLLNKMLDAYHPKRRPFGPALIFLDQFGYGSVPMELVNRVLSHPQCEVLTFLDASHLNRFLDDPPKDRARTKAFGGEEWRKALEQPEGKRAMLLRKIYRENMKQYGAAEWVWDFAMLNEIRIPICWLFFGTNSIRGLEEMKLAMRRVDSDFAYADADSLGQIKLFNSCDDDWLKTHLADRFAGQVVTVEEIHRHVLEHTPLVSFANVLRSLRSERRIEDIGGSKIAYSKKEGRLRKVCFEERGLAFE